ncbi:hypothetical protein GCM10022219_11410 [Microbacterium oryzae]|uniref:Uncharacterized protein n=1 Tax=Microbacterium oryzae TaxID=743009 RepID=A0A6I6DWF0_9MICO|nr:hypothetical protein [Microbacterium oryzae]QGU28486.1 hypothetical protein D7D94_12995 [Microbacterium oryzae]
MRRQNLSERLRTRPTTWAVVDAGFHVASRRGEFVGVVDTDSEGRFLAFDGRGQIIGAFVDIAEAMAEVEAHASDMPTRQLAGV